MEAEEIETRAARARRKVFYEEKAPFGWLECLVKIRGMLADPVWEGEELEEACRKYFERGADEMRELVGMEVVVRSVREKPAGDEERKKFLAAERSRRYREKLKEVGQ